MRPLVIVGPTASGKSSLALEIATRTPGAHIVSADAMAVYQDMTVGTAKPTQAEREMVPHHLVDVAKPAEDYTLSLYAEQVDAVVAELNAQDVPMVFVGGTGLYVQAVVDDFTLPPAFPEIRQELEANPNTEELWLQLQSLDPEASTKMEPTNRRRTIRALEVCLGSGQKFSSFGPGVDAYGETDFVLVGLEIDRPTLDERISQRYETQMANGFLEEVKSLPADLSRTARQALGYKELLDHLAGNTTVEEAIDLAVRRTRKFARRQQRWFRRDPRIQWFEALDADLADQVETWWEQRR